MEYQFTAEVLEKAVENFAKGTRPRTSYSNAARSVKDDVRYARNVTSLKQTKHEVDLLPRFKVLSDRSPSTVSILKILEETVSPVPQLKNTRCKQELVRNLFTGLRR